MELAESPLSDAGKRADHPGNGGWGAHRRSPGNEESGVEDAARSQAMDLPRAFHQTRFTGTSS
jgi:hypothetical protein